jgi:hypothetical protein
LTLFEFQNCQPKSVQVKYRFLEGYRGVTGEMKERYGRDKNNLSRAEHPFYKGDSSDDGRDGAFFTPLLIIANYFTAEIV